MNKKKDRMVMYGGRIRKLRGVVHVEMFESEIGHMYESFGEFFLLFF